MRKLLIFLSLILSTHVLSGCSSCETATVSTDTTDVLAFSIIITNPDGTSFEKVYTNLDQHRPFVFEFISFYDRPNEELPESLRNYTFFFRSTALPNGESLFDQSADSDFLVGESGGQDYEQMSEDQSIIYREVTPENVLLWTPTSYNGAVQVIDDPEGDRIAIFDITFTDGIESRRIQATYSFYQGLAEVEGANCD